MILEQDYQNAVREVEMLVQLKAKECQARGWSYYLTDDAPETYEGLKKRSAYMNIPIADYGSDTSIYSPRINGLFRFWHDVTHLELDRGFSLSGEEVVCREHLAEGKELGLSILALRILEADTCGQVAYYFKHKKFVENQAAFVQSVLNRGLSNALRVKH